MAVADWIGDPRDLLGSLTRLSLVHTAMATMAELGVADHIGETPTPVDVLAQACGTDEASLRRALNFLASEGLVRMTQDGLVAHTDYSRMLRSGHPLMVREQLATSVYQEAFLRTAQGVRTGDVPFNIRFGMSFFEYLEKHPEIARSFAEYMSVTTRVIEDAIFAAHAFRPFRLAVDVGGSHGSLLRRLLREHPAANGVVFDLPHVAREAEGRWSGAADAPRLRAIGGSFFETAPEGADLYLLKQILHDWKDSDCVTILRNLRRVMAPDGRVAVIEITLPETPAPHPGWAMDLLMLTVTGGRERKLSEFEVLFEEAGLALDAATGINSAMTIIEAVPA